MGIEISFLCDALYIERHLQASHQDESDPQDQQMESGGSDDQDTSVKTLSGPEDQPRDLDSEDQPRDLESEVQPQEVDKELQQKYEDEKPEQQDGCEQQLAQVVESEQVTGESCSDQQVSDEVGVGEVKPPPVVEVKPRPVGEVKPRPLMEMKPTSDYYSASDGTKEEVEEEEEEVSMAVENIADPNENVDTSVNADAAKEVSLCT